MADVDQTIGGTVLFEHPLNEFTRTALRIEYLLSLAAQALADPSHLAPYGFWRALFDLMELLDRGDVRQDLIKELDRTINELPALVSRGCCPGTAEQELREQLQQHVQTLRSCARLGQPLRDDRFFMTLRQRFALAAGQCSFDLPQFHLWLHRPEEVRRSQMRHYLGLMEPVQRAFGDWLHLVRCRGKFSSEMAVGGFYQNSAEQLQLLRIRLSPSVGAFPSISGNRLRFTVRFVAPQADRECFLDHDVAFDLARC